jgi:hypothetical protein
VRLAPHGRKIFRPYGTLQIDLVGAQNLAPATVKNGTLQIDLVGAQNLAPATVKTELCE